MARGAVWTIEKLTKVRDGMFGEKDFIHFGQAETYVKQNIGVSAYTRRNVIAMLLDADLMESGRPSDPWGFRRKCGGGKVQ